MNRVVSRNPWLHNLALVALLAGSFGAGCKAKKKTPEECKDISTCTAVGETACSDGRISTCVDDGDGCLVWDGGRACDRGTCADDASCTGCVSTCAAVGATFCSGGVVQTCV